MCLVCVNEAAGCIEGVELICCEAQTEPAGETLARRLGSS